MKEFDQIQADLGNFGLYQIRVLFATQICYLCVTGSMLCTIFDNIRPENVSCSAESPLGPPSHTPPYSNLSLDFHSLVFDLGLLCAHHYIPTLLSTGVMLGGVCGAGVWGWAADRWGRRPGTIIPLIGCLVMNVLMASFGNINSVFTGVLLFSLGFFGGGYLVTNLVSLLEAVGGEYCRLGAASVNGWPAGLMFMGLMGHFSGHWKWYHLSLAAAGVPCVVLLFLFVEESPRWLLQHGRKEESWKTLKIIAKLNRTSSKLPDYDSFVLENGDNPHVVNCPDKNYTYLDLFRHSTIVVNLFALTYSWLASSVISFGIYFNLDNLAGNRFLNLFFTGIFKGTTGVIPFLVSRWVGRKPVLLVGASLACLSSWAAVTVFFVSENPQSSAVLTVFTMVGAGAIDPIWKVNHLYSTELFPTVVRNMARAVCNIGSRVGSVIAPQVAHLRSLFGPLPFIIFGCLSVVHVVISAVLLPETKGKPLPEQLNHKNIRDNASPRSLESATPLVPMENTQGVINT